MASASCLEKSGLKGWQRDFATLSKQVHEYSDWIRSAVLPHARKTNRLPPEIYADNLKNWGVEMDPHQLMDRAQVSYQTTRDELDSLARQVSKAKGFPSSDYRDVIRELKKDQVPNDQLLAKYRDILGQLEDVTRARACRDAPEPTRRDPARDGGRICRTAGAARRMHHG